MSNELRNRSLNELDQSNSRSNSQRNQNDQNDQPNSTDRNVHPSPNRLNFDDEDFVYLLNLSNFNWRVVLSPLLNLFNYNNDQQTIGNRQTDQQTTNQANFERRRSEESANLTANILNNDTLLTENITETFDIHLNFNQNTVFISRSHLIRVIFFKITTFYVIFFPSKMRKTIEYGLLASAILSFLTLIYLHSLFIRSPINCLQNVHERWNGEGILRVEILDEQEKMINLNLEQNLSTKDLEEFEIFSKQGKAI